MQKLRLNYVYMHRTTVTTNTIIFYDDETPSVPALIRNIQKPVDFEVSKGSSGTKNIDDFVNACLSFQQKETIIPSSTVERRKKWLKALYIRILVTFLLRLVVVFLG